MSERRVRALFLVVLAGQLILLTTQVPGPQARGSAFEALSLRLTGPVARAVDRGAEGAAAARQTLRLRSQLETENQALRAEVEQLRIQAMRQQDLVEETRRLASALEYTWRSGASFRLADVVLSDHASWLRTLVVYCGAAGARVNQPVVVTSGLVGRVIAASGGYAKVQLVTDRAASVGAMLERTRRQGIVRGDGEGGLELDFVPLQSPVVPGDRVVSAGIDGVFPRGLPVGTVASVEAGSELFHRIRVVPAVDFGLIDQVYLLEHVPIPDLKEPDSGGP